MEAGEGGGFGQSRVEGGEKMSPLSLNNNKIIEKLKKIMKEERLQLIPQKYKGL